MVRSSAITAGSTCGAEGFFSMPVFDMGIPRAPSSWPEGFGPRSRLRAARSCRFPGLWRAPTGPLGDHKGTLSRHS